VIEITTALAVIDGWMSANNGRSLYSEEEVHNVLLDIRTIISPLALDVETVNG
jgi:hypothetical protein